MVNSKIHELFVDGLRIYQASDFHIEFWRNRNFIAQQRKFLKTIKFSGEYDLIVLNGDIGTAVSEHYRKAYKRFVDVMCSFGLPVIHVCGNHEYYGLQIGKDGADNNFLVVQDFIDDLSTTHKNFYSLNEKRPYIDLRIKSACYRIVGSTLWTTLNNGNNATIAFCGALMNDYKHIIVEHCHLTTKDTMELHKKQLQAMETAILQLPKDHKLIIVTHHAPLLESTRLYHKHNGSKQEEVDWAYASNLQDFLGRIWCKEPLVWIHGHIHAKFDYEWSFNCHTMKVICNPFGYPLEKTGF